jgi:hypothetical protein
MTSANHLTAVQTSGRSVHVQKRELGEVINYAITAFKKKVPVEKIFVLSPTDATGYLAAYVQGAMEHQLNPWLLRRPPAERIRVIEHALRAYQQHQLPFDMLYTVTPTAHNVTLAAFVDAAIVHHMVGAVAQ